MTTPDTLVTDAQLAALANVSPRRIRQLAESGVLERVERNQYELGPSIQALLEEAAGTGSALVRERTRKLAAEATRAELELAKAKGLVAPIEQMANAWGNYCRIIQINMRAIPRRAVIQLLHETNETTWKQKLLAEIDLALKSAADTEFEPNEDDEHENDY